MGIQDISQEALNLVGVADGASAVAAIVGDSISFAPRSAAFGTPTTTLTRKPAGSSASVSSNAITFDVPGYYTVTCTSTTALGSRAITVYAFPAAVLTQKSQPGAPYSALVSRTHLSQLILDPRVTLANITATLETTGNAWNTGAGCPAGLLSGGAPFDWRAYGP